MCRNKVIALYAVKTATVFCDKITNIRYVTCHFPKALRLMFETSRKVCRKNRSKCKKVASPPSSAESSREGKGERKRKGEKTGRSSIHLSEIPARSPFSSPILQYICCSRALILKNPGNLCGGERGQSAVMFLRARKQSCIVKMRLYMLRSH